jgi:hypothetical protein
MEGYKKITDKKGNVLYVNQKACPFHGFTKCIGSECSLYSITGYVEHERTINFGECAFFKIPSLLITLQTSKKD